MSQQAFFTKIDSTKNLDIVDSLLKSSSLLVIKINEQHFKSKILGQKNDSTFTILKFAEISFNYEEAVCSFDYGNGKFFFKSKLSSNNTDLTVSMTVPTEIFQLQRRNDFRINLGTGAGYLCDITKVNGLKKIIKEIELRNLSLGGCQIALPFENLALKQNDEVALKFKIKEFEAENIPAVAKHIKKGEAAGTALIGLQFIEPDASFLTNLQMTLVQLDRIHRNARIE